MAARRELERNNRASYLICKQYYSDSQKVDPVFDLRHSLLVNNILKQVKSQIRYYSVLMRGELPIDSTSEMLEILEPL